MSWSGCELITVTTTSTAGICSSSSRRAAPTAAHRPAKPEPRTTTFFTAEAYPSAHRRSAIQNCKREWTGRRMGLNIQTLGNYIDVSNQDLLVRRNHEHAS